MLDVKGHTLIQVCSGKSIHINDGAIEACFSGITPGWPGSPRR